MHKSPPNGRGCLSVCLVIVMMKMMSWWWCHRWWGGVSVGLYLKPLCVCLCCDWLPLCRWIFIFLLFDNELLCTCRTCVVSFLWSRCSFRHFTTPSRVTARRCTRLLFKVKGWKSWACNADWPTAEGNLEPDFEKTHFWQTGSEWMTPTKLTFIATETLKRAATVCYMR